MRIAKCLILMLFCVPAFLGCNGETDTQVIESPTDTTVTDDPATTDPVVDEVEVEDTTDDDA